MKPEILLAPNIPKPLHGIAPRVIYGQDWWDVERKKCYANAGQKCECCDTPRSQAWPKPWLEAHEWYVYDYSNGLITFDHLICLCPACHMFLHSGHTNMLLNDGKISEEIYLKILKHGEKILFDAGLTVKYHARHDSTVEIPWQSWRMQIGDQLYGPSSKSYSDWEAGAWRNWKP